MKTLYLECGMGASGDMLMGALSELVDQNAFVNTMNHLGLKGIHAEAVPCEKCGIIGTHMKITFNGAEEYSEDVNEDALFTCGIENLPLDEKDHILHHISQINGIHDVTLNGSVLTYRYNHDHGQQALDSIRDILADHAPDSKLIPQGHKHLSDHQHPEMHLQQIHELLSELNLSESVRKNAEEVYQSIAEAESYVHHTDIDNIHFHEVGTMDAIADVAGCCILFDQIGADRILASPVATGSGMVHCAHGILPVPAPAAAYLLQGIPTYAGRFEGELCTPTGAALLKHFVTSFEKRPVMVTQKIGYGMGSKDFEACNCIRAFLGESEDDGEVAELACNLDDISSEEIGHAVDVLFENGALDVYTTPVQMKKNRPGIVFTCMCRTDDVEKMTALMFRHLTTLGIREYRCPRHALHRESEVIQTSFGPVRRKRSSGYGIVREKIEYEDLRKIADEKGISIAEARDLVERELK